MNLKWKAASGYVQGIGHVENNEPCQDRAIHIHDEELHGIVLADGAGSCRMGERGAELVVQTFLRYSKEKFDEWYQSENPDVVIEQFLLQVIDEETAKHEGTERMDFSCTVLFVLVKNNQYLAGHIGDGVIFQRINNELSVLSHPENGRYANETYFITMAPLYEHFRIYKGSIENHMDFMLMSDGAATSFYIHSDREIDKANTSILFNHLVENEEELVMKELPDLLELVKENTSDDCAIAVMTSHTIDMIEDIGEVPEVEPETESDMIAGAPSIHKDEEMTEEQNRALAERAEKRAKIQDVSNEKMMEEPDLHNQGEESSDTIHIEGLQLDLPQQDEEVEEDSQLFIEDEEDYSPELEDEEYHHYTDEFDFEEDDDYTSELEEIEETPSYDEEEEYPSEYDGEEEEEYLSEYDEDEQEQEQIPMHVEEEQELEQLWDDEENEEEKESFSEQEEESPSSADEELDEPVNLLGAENSFEESEPMGEEGANEDQQIHSEGEGSGQKNHDEGRKETCDSSSN